MRTKDEFNEQKQRQQLLNAAWKLFYQNGYQNTTMEDILKEAHCSKGRFYYYFHAKAELLDSMYELFDEKYEEFYRSIDKTLGSFEGSCLPVFTSASSPVLPESVSGVSSVPL